MKMVKSDLISLPKAQRHLACGPQALKGLIQSGRLTVLDVPGSFKKVSRSEVEALAGEFTKSAVQGN